MLGFDDDLRNYRVAAQMLKAMSVSIVKLHTNNPKKREGLENNGIKVFTNIPTSLHVTDMVWDSFQERSSNYYDLIFSGGKL